MTDMRAAPGSGRAPAGAEPGLIRRRDLMAALDRAAQKRVTIISAPAGTGKTTLLRAWADQPRPNHRIAFRTHLDAVTEQAAAPVIAKYTGVLGGADIDIFTWTTTFAIMQSIRLDRGPSGPVHP